jgi:hypothetical protein
MYFWSKLLTLQRWFNTYFSAKENIPTDHANDNLAACDITLASSQATVKWNWVMGSQSGWKTNWVPCFGAVNIYTYCESGATITTDI